MTAQGRNVLRDALALAPSERAVLVEEILSSFDHAATVEIDAAWAKEAEARIDAYDRGEMGSISVREAFEGLERRDRQ